MKILPPEEGRAHRSCIWRFIFNPVRSTNICVPKYLTDDVLNLTMIICHSLR